MIKMETRQYKITATKEQLDILETMFSTMEKMGKAGASREIVLYVDGDGAFHPEFIKYHNGVMTSLTNLVSNNKNETIHHGDGTILENTENFKGDGYYIFYDFG